MARGSTASSDVTVASPARGSGQRPQTERWASGAGIWKLVRSEDVWLGLIALAGAVVALTGSPFWAQFASTLAYFAILTMGLNIVLGMAGQLDFGHAVYFAVGAYAAGKVMVADPTLDFIVVILIAAAAAAAISFVLGFPVFRLRGDFVALITVALAEIAATLASNLGWLGGANGVTSIPAPTILGFQFTATSSMLWLGVVLFVVTAVIARGIGRIRFGRALIAIREDELAARCVGVRPLRYKIAAYTVAGLLAGVAGAYFAGLLGFVGPTSFDINQSFVLGEAVILGGIGSMLGSVLGAGVLVGIQDLLVLYVPQVSGHEDLVVGALVLVIILIRPQGVLGRPFVRRRT